MYSGSFGLTSHYNCAVHHRELFGMWGFGDMHDTCPNAPSDDVCLYENRMSAYMYTCNGHYLGPEISDVGWSDLGFNPDEEPSLVLQGIGSHGLLTKPETKSIGQKYWHDFSHPKNDRLTVVRGDYISYRDWDSEAQSLGLDCNSGDCVDGGDHYIENWQGGVWNVDDNPWHYHPIRAEMWKTANTHMDHFKSINNSHNIGAGETAIGANGIQYGPRGNLYFPQIFEAHIKTRPGGQPNQQDMGGGTSGQPPNSTDYPNFKASWQLLGPHSHPYLYGARGNNRWYGLRKSSLSGLPLERWGVAQNLFKFMNIGQDEMDVLVGNGPIRSEEDGVLGSLAPFNNPDLLANKIQLKPYMDADAFSTAYGGGFDTCYFIDTWTGNSNDLGAGMHNYDGQGETNENQYPWACVPHNDNIVDDNGNPVDTKEGVFYDEEFGDITDSGRYYLLKNVFRKYKSSDQSVWGAPSLPWLSFNWIADMWFENKRNETDGNLSQHNYFHNKNWCPGYGSEEEITNAGLSNVCLLQWPSSNANNDDGSSWTNSNWATNARYNLLAPRREPFMSVEHIFHGFDQGLDGYGWANMNFGYDDQGWLIKSLSSNHGWPEYDEGGSFNNKTRIVNNYPGIAEWSMNYLASGLSKMGGPPLDNDFYTNELEAGSSTYNDNAYNINIYPGSQYADYGQPSGCGDWSGDGHGE